MATDTQTYASHTRWYPLHHFILMPLLLLIFVYSLIQLFRFPDYDRVMWLAVSVGLLILSVVARLSALRVQDRLIMLEEQLRYQKVLPEAAARHAGKLTRAQVIALRFASDEELPDLVKRVSDGELTRGDEIKRAVKQWRPDTLRV